MAYPTTPVTPVPGPPAYQVLGQSPHIQRFGVLRRSVVIRDIAIANHSTLGNAPTAWGTGVLPEGSVLYKGTDGNWYMWGTTGGAAQALESSGGAPQLSVLIDPYDTTFNGAGNPVVGQAYFSGCFIMSFIQLALNTPWSNQGTGSIESFLRANDIIVEGTTQVQPGTPYPGTGYGVSIPREDAPV
jgi:hypothetical protein